MFSVRKSGNTFIASGESVRGFGLTEDEAILRWEAMYRADQKTYSGAQPHLPKRILQREDGTDYKEIALTAIVSRRKKFEKEQGGRTVEETATASVQ